ncbi:MAG: hypothetical protein H7246_06250 [Phycisphaerae bacterium]|nr:hypothetical protein [Saprospiraceae bacterium]
MNPIRLSQRPLALFLACLVALSSLSCYSRNRMQSSRLPKIQNIQGLEFLLIDASAPISNVWLLSRPKFEQNALSARLDRATEAFGQRIASIRTNGDRKASKDLVLIYITPKTAMALADTLTTRLDYKEITRIEVFEPDAGKVVGTILLGLGGCAALSLIALIIACNCPHVYTEAPDGTRQLEGSLYSGAVYLKLERSDYLPLEHLQPIDNHYKIWLVNQEAQRQHTNLAALEVIDHAPGLQPIFDKYGTLHTLQAPQAPFDATNVSGKNVLNEVIAQDLNTFLGDLNNPSADAVEKLTLSFAKPAGAKKAKLLLRAKTDQWVDYVYYEFQNALGQYADEVNRKYSQKSAAENQAWIEDQKLPIAVWLETSPGHWIKTDHFALAGGSAFREDVLPLDLSKIAGDVVRVRLEFGFHFWEIDRTALDFSEDQSVLQTTLRPLSAQDDEGQDVTASLTDDDGFYYHQPNLGDEASLQFEVPPLQPGLERSLVLRAKGYYEVLHQNAPGRPSLFKLNAWKKENALPRLSMERWRSAQGLSIQSR